MSITTAQIRGARGILNWSQQDLAQRTGISATSIGAIENGQTTPRESTLSTIRKTLENAGIEFIGLEGIRQRRDDVRIFSCKDGLIEFYDDIYATVRDKASEVLVSNVDERVFVEALGDYAKIHVNRMEEQKNVRYKILVKEGDDYTPGSGYGEYRWIPKELFASVPFYVYGKKLAIMLFENEPSIILLQYPSISDAYRVQFFDMWERAKLIESKKAIKKSMNAYIDHKTVAAGSVSTHESYDKGFNPVEEVTRVTSDTFGRKNLAMAGKIAYVDEGASLYEAFKRSRLPDNDSSQSAPARLLTMHKSSIAASIRDSERLIVVGGGSYESFMNQEMVLLTEIFAQDKKAPLREIVLIDVSGESLEDGHRAIEEISARIGQPLKALSIRSDYKNASGEAFDNIMAGWGSKKREDIRAAVIMTGGTFGNLEGITSTEAFPINDVDKQMAHIGEFVGQGSTVIFDHFTRMETAEHYYNSPELAAFMTNIPQIMKRYCKGLSNFRVNDPSYDDPYFSYRARSIPIARLVTHQLIAETPQNATLMNGVKKILTIADKYTVMVSLYPSVDDINRRPAANTGLENQFHVSSKDLVLHVYKKIGRPAVLFEEDDITYTSLTRGAGMPAGALAIRPVHHIHGGMAVHAAATL